MFAVVCHLSLFQPSLPIAMVSTLNANFLSMDFIAFLQVLFAFAVVVQFLLEDVPIPDDVILEIAMQTVEEHNLSPLAGKHRHRKSVSPSSSNQPKWPLIQSDYKRAEKNVISNWVGAVPHFPDKKFEHTFRIMQYMVDIILNHLASQNSFWTKTVDQAGNKTINPNVKLPCSLKMICYGISGHAFIDYNQFGETTSCCCVHHLVRGLVSCCALSEVYLRKPSKADSCKISTMHGNVHKMPGMLGSLDVTKVHWNNCPTALKGQFQGREKCATITLVSIVNYNLWFWHASFGFPGTMNDIIIWEWSGLLESILNGNMRRLIMPLLLMRKYSQSYIALWMGSISHCQDFLDQRLSHQQSWMVVSKLIRKDHKRMLNLVTVY